MVTKFGRVITCSGRTLTSKSRDLLINEPYISTSAILMAIKLGRVVTYGWKTPPSKSHDLLITQSRDKWNKTYICTSTIPMVTKFGKVVTYGGRTPHNYSHDLWWCVQLANEKSYYCIFTILIASKSGWRLEDPTLQVTWSLITWSREKLKNLCLHFNNTYDGQTWQSDGLGWGTPSTKSQEGLIKWSYGHYLWNIFKWSVAILLIILSLLSVVLSRWENNFDTILFNFSELLALETNDLESNDLQIYKFLLIRWNQTRFFHTHSISICTTHLRYDSVSQFPHIEVKIICR